MVKIIAEFKKNVKKYQKKFDKERKVG